MREELRYNSLYAALKDAEELPWLGKTQNESRKQDYSGWSGTETFEEGVKLARDGWVAMRPAVDEALGVVEHEISEAIPEIYRTYNDYSGAAVDMDTFLMGDPQCMVNFVQEPTAAHGRVVTIIMNGGVSCAVSAERIVKRGVAIAALIGALAKLQHSTELYVEKHTQSSSRFSSVHPEHHWSCLVRIKAASEAEDVDSMLFAIAHPSMQRRIFFSLLERTSKRRWDSHGCSGPVERADEVGAQIIIDDDEHQTLMENEPAEWVRQQLIALDLI